MQLSDGSFPEWIVKPQIPGTMNIICVCSPLASIHNTHVSYSQRLMSADHTHPELIQPVQLNLQTDYELNFTQEDNLSTTIHVHPVNPVLKNFRSYKLSCCTTEVRPLTVLSVRTYTISSLFTYQLSSAFPGAPITIKIPCM